jgi:hypothetical protein
LPPVLRLQPNLPPIVRGPSRPRSDAENDIILIGPDNREDPEFTFGEVPTYMQATDEFGNTTTVTSFPDGSRRVTTLDADGNIVSNQTTGPRGSDYPSATSTHGDGSTHTAQGNYFGDHDVTHSSADGSVAGAENHQAGHANEGPSATIHNPDGSSATSSGDASGNRAVGGTDATGNAATTTVGQSDSATNTNPDGSSSTVVGTNQGHAVTNTNAQGDSSTTVHDASHNNAPSATLHNPDGSSATSTGNAAGGHTVSGTDAFGNPALANW